MNSYSIGDRVRLRYITPPHSNDPMIGRVGTLTHANNRDDDYALLLDATATDRAEEIICDSENIEGIEE